MSKFSDHFSALAAGYQQFRPRYPDALLDWLAAQVQRHDQAWDCGTGSGQAALALAGRFAHVLATDASAEQIAHGEPHDRVEYRVAPAEASGLPEASVDLVTVAQALHWFDLPAFYGEVRRVLRPDGLIAVWCYSNLTLSDARLDELFSHFYHGVVGPYWPAERAFVESGYATLDFPFRRIEAPPFHIEASMTLDAFAGYLRTWSACKRYVQANDADPVAAFLPELEAAWGKGSDRVIRWPLHLKAGRP